MISPEAKAAIDEEERILAEVKASLLKQAEKSSLQFVDHEKLSRELNARYVASTRDDVKQSLASDSAVAHGLSKLKRAEVSGLDKLIERPYFARLVIEEYMANGSKKIVEYRIGTIANSDCRILDWKRAPVAKLYYEYREGDEFSEIIRDQDRDGRVLLRNQLEIEAGELKKVICRFGTFTKEGGEWIEGGGTARNRRSGSGLPPVEAFVTKDQFSAITEEADSAILIQGIAGSGKTTVALYRLAWLLANHGAEVRPQRCAIVVKSPVLKRYVERSLPFFDIAGVPVFTYREWVEPTVQKATAGRGHTASAASGEDDETESDISRQERSVKRVKQSMALLLALEQYALDQRIRFAKYLEANFPWEQVNPETRKTFDKAVIDKTTGQIGGGFAPLILLGALAAGSANDQEAVRLLEHLHSRMTVYFDDLLHLAADSNRILAHDETRLIDRDLLGRFEKQLQAERTEAGPDEDTAALLVRLYQLKNGAVAFKDGSTGLYDHVVVDEAQDFSPAELATIVGAVSSPDRLTIVGDISQQISRDETFPGWERLRKYWNLGGSISRFFSLDVSHRSTLPIMRLAEAVSGKGRAVNGRDGRVPIWFHCRNENGGVREAIGWLQKAIERYPDERTAVICRTLAQAKYVESILRPSFGAAVTLGSDDAFDFDEGIVVAPLSAVKGLEFFNVMLWNPSEKAYPDSVRGKSMLYVALTRAEENLSLISWGQISPNLPEKYSRLVRSVDEEKVELPDDKPPRLLDDLPRRD